MKEQNHWSQSSASIGTKFQTRVQQDQDRAQTDLLDNHDHKMQDSTAQIQSLPAQTQELLQVQVQNLTAQVAHLETLTAQRPYLTAQVAHLETLTAQIPDLTFRWRICRLCCSIFLEVTEYSYVNDHYVVSSELE